MKNAEKLELSGLATRIPLNMKMDALCVFIEQKPQYQRLTCRYLGSFSHWRTHLKTVLRSSIRWWVPGPSVAIGKWDIWWQSASYLRSVTSCRSEKDGHRAQTEDEIRRKGTWNEDHRGQLLALYLLCSRSTKTRAEPKLRHFVIWLRQQQ